MMWARSLTGGMLAAAFTAGLAAASPAAQSAAVADLQAAFLLNFARFTQWPDARKGSTLVMCIAADDRLADAVTKSIHGQAIEGRPLEMRRMRGGESAAPCHLLFVSKSLTAGAAPLLQDARRQPVLTVSDREGFARSDGIIELFLERDRMRFAVNVELARRARLHLSSRLLNLSKVVHGKPGF
ncbi:MAG: YfiR family protein [Acidobacteriota bacterium]|nr:YfiR family protein [Acidobacteriota bacterium]